MSWDEDPQLAAEMVVCEHYRIPHSEFLRWAAEDRAKAIWWRARQLSTCPNCGTRPEEWDDDRGGDWHAYEAVLRRCRGCQVTGKAEDELSRMPKAERGHGVRISLQKPEQETP